MDFPLLESQGLVFNPKSAIQNPKWFGHYADIYLSGTLTVDFPEEIKLPILPDQYQTIILSGATVQMDYCGIEKAIAILKEQYAVGTITAKIIQPRPKN